MLARSLNYALVSSFLYYTWGRKFHDNLSIVALERWDWAFHAGHYRKPSTFIRWPRRSIWIISPSLKRAHDTFLGTWICPFRARSIPYWQGRSNLFFISDLNTVAGYLNDIARLHLCTNTSSELIHTLQESNALLQSVFLAHEEDSDFVMMQKDFRSSASAVPRVEVCLSI